MHSAPYFAALGLLTIAHSLAVVQLRRKLKIGIGDGGNPDLARMMRVFGNHAEYVPMGLILIIGLEFVDAPVWYLHLTGVSLLTGRILHGLGLSRTSGYSTGRTLGILLTYLSIALASVGVILFSLTANMR